MIIGIDVRVLGNQIKSGIEEYTENLIPQLIKEGSGIKFKLFYSSHKNSLPAYNWLNESNVELHKFKLPNNYLFATSRILNRPFIDKKVGGADVFFFPHFFISSLSPSCKRVTTFHDLSYLHFPEFITRRKKIWHRFQMMPNWQAKFSDKIISVSESTKKDLIKFYKIDPARIEVIYSGVRDKASKKRDEEVLNFKKEKKLPDRFILFIGKLEPRKNVTSIIKAFNKLKVDPRYSDLGLVVAGSRGWLYKDIINETNLSPYKNQIIFTNHIGNETRFLYYQAASIFVYPSFFEGFGFPPLEAMSCGTPVITSINSSLSEVVGDAAIMIDPYDVDELELWIKKLLHDNTLIRTLKIKGIERAGLFNWATTAKKTLECLVK